MRSTQPARGWVLGFFTENLVLAYSLLVGVGSVMPTWWNMEPALCHPGPGGQRSVAAPMLRAAPPPAGGLETSASTMAGTLPDTCSATSAKARVGHATARAVLRTRSPRSISTAATAGARPSRRRRRRHHPMARSTGLRLAAQFRGEATCVPALAKASSQPGSGARMRGGG